MRINIKETFKTNVQMSRQRLYLEKITYSKIIKNLLYENVRILHRAVARNQQ